MRKQLLATLLIISTSFGLSACTITRHVNNQQGNVITKKQMDQLKLGMTEQQVAFVLGDTTLDYPFASNQVRYVYTNQASWGKLQIKQLVLTFNHNKLVNISGNYLDNPEQELTDQSKVKKT